MNFIELKFDKTFYEIDEAVKGQIEIHINEGEEVVDTFILEIKGWYFAEWIGKLENVGENMMDICSSYKKLDKVKVVIDTIKDTFYETNRFTANKEGGEKIYSIPFEFKMSKGDLPASFDFRSYLDLWKKGKKAMIQYNLDFSVCTQNKKPIVMNHILNFIEKNNGSFYSNGEVANSRGITMETDKPVMGGNVILKGTVPQSGKCKLGDSLSILISIENKTKMKITSVKIGLVIDVTLYAETFLYGLQKETFQIKGPKKSSVVQTVNILPETTEELKIVFTVPKHMHTSLNFNKQLHYNYSLMVKIPFIRGIGSVKLGLPLTIYPDYMDKNLKKSQTCKMFLGKNKAMNETSSSSLKTSPRKENSSKKTKTKEKSKDKDNILSYLIHNIKNKIDTNNVKRSKASTSVIGSSTFEVEYRDKEGEEKRKDNKLKQLGMKASRINTLTDEDKERTDDDFEETFDENDISEIYPGLNIPEIYSSASDFVEKLDVELEKMRALIAYGSLDLDSLAGVGGDKRKQSVDSLNENSYDHTSSETNSSPRHSSQQNLEKNQRKSTGSLQNVDLSVLIPTSTKKEEKSNQILPPTNTNPPSLISFEPVLPPPLPPKQKKHHVDKDKSNQQLNLIEFNNILTLNDPPIQPKNDLIDFNSLTPAPNPSTDPPPVFPVKNSPLITKFSKLESIGLKNLSKLPPKKNLTLNDSEQKN